MREFRPEFDPVVRRLGWELAPDLDSAERAVERRAAELAVARRTQHSARARAGLVAAVAAVVLVAASPVLAARFGAIDRPIASPTTAERATTRPNVNDTKLLAGPLDSFSDVPVVGITAPPAAGSTSQVPSCTRDDVTLETEFGQEVYAPGDAAVVTLVLRNASRVACSAQADRCTSEISVFDASGVDVYSSGAHRYLCQVPGDAGPAQPVRRLLQPGQAMTMTFKWLERGCSETAVGPGCALAAPGRYTVTGDWAGFPTAAGGPGILSPEYRLRTLPRHLTIA